MKLLIYIFLLSSSVFAIDYDCKAIVRDSKHNLVIKTVTIKDLLSRDSFDGRHFKIVEKKNIRAISFNSKLALRACTVYFHLSKARSYFEEHFDLEILKKPRALVSRIEMDLGFEESAHFMHENNGKMYNNAVTIPPSDLNRISDRPWYYEIWFAPKKKVKIDNTTYTASELVTSGPFMANMLMGIAQSQVTTIGIDLVRGSAFEPSFYFKTLMLSVGITAAVPYALKYVSKPFKRTIFLDSAMIPEVIYHEFTHFALSQQISIDRHSPVVEGIANFYASQISKTDTILKKAKKYAKGLVKISAKKSKNYDYFMEDSSYAQLDFTYKFLYSLKEKFGEAFSAELVFKAVENLKGQEDLSIKNGLISALIKSMDQLKASKTKKLILIKQIQAFGF